MLPGMGGCRMGGVIRFERGIASSAVITKLVDLRIPSARSAAPRDRCRKGNRPAEKRPSPPGESSATAIFRPRPRMRTSRDCSALSSASGGLELAQAPLSTALGRPTHVSSSGTPTGRRSPTSTSRRSPRAGARQLTCSPAKRGPAGKDQHHTNFSRSKLVDQID